jgi:hypothetical protein
MEMGVSIMWGHAGSLKEESSIIREATLVTNLVTQIQPIMDDALNKVVMEKIVLIVKPPFIFARKFTPAELHGNMGDVLETHLKALNMAAGSGAHCTTLGAAHPMAMITPPN